MENQEKKEVAKTSAEVKLINKQITDQVLEKINSFQQNKELTLPKDYSPENALKSALLVLSEQKDKNGVSVLEACTKTSVANALLKMVVEGMSVIKKQGYFIPYGKDLTWSRSYQGSVALAKRLGDVKDVVSNVIYQDDVFEFQVDVETGYKRIIKHEQKIENIDNGKIKGAYAVVIYNDGRKDLEVMTLAEIKQAWMQGQMKGNSGAHNNFTQEMCKKTVINRACKTPINSSNDANLYHSDEQEEQETKSVKVIEANEQEEQIREFDFQDAEEIQEQEF